MVEFTTGDLFSEQADVRVNTVNCVGVMGKGVALAFKNRYPDMFKDYQRACKQGLVSPGTLHFWKSVEGERIINFPTKRHWRNPSQYEDIQAGLNALRTHLGELGDVRVVLPALGCGHGGLDWAKVAPMIKEYLGDLAATIRVFEPSDSRRLNSEKHTVQTAGAENDALAELGWHRTELNKSTHSLSGLVKGDASCITAKRLVLFTSKKPSDRELKALELVAGEMTRSQSPVVVSLVHTTRDQEKVAELFVKNGVSVLMVLPFGPLTRKTVSSLPVNSSNKASLCLASVAAPGEAWSPKVMRRSENFLFETAIDTMVTSPQVSIDEVRALCKRMHGRVSYLRYDETDDEVRAFLKEKGAHQITKDKVTGRVRLPCSNVDND